jgi:hypothetical protein
MAGGPFVAGGIVVQSWTGYKINAAQDIVAPGAFRTCWRCAFIRCII